MNEHDEKIAQEKEKLAQIELYTRMERDAETETERQRLRALIRKLRNELRFPKK